MFFVLSKTIGFVVEPVDLIVLVGLLGLILAVTRFARAGRAIAAASILVLAIVCFSPLPSLLLRPLEDRFPPPPADLAAPAGIVVLGGALNEDIGAARGVPTITEAGARLTTGVALALRYPGARLVFTGGASDLGLKGLDEARGVHDLWLSLGVPEQRMLFENASRNTYENATMTRTLVAPRPGETWLLVTSAAHMPRATGIFRHVGWPMVAYPVDYRTFGDTRDWLPSSKPIENLRKLDVALHEWSGLVAYRVTGKTDALFPAP